MVVRGARGMEAPRAAAPVSKIEHTDIGWATNEHCLPQQPRTFTALPIQLRVRKTVWEGQVLDRYTAADSIYTNVAPAGSPHTALSGLSSCVSVHDAQVITMSLFWGAPHLSKELGQNQGLDIIIPKRRPFDEEDFLPSTGGYLEECRSHHFYRTPLNEFK